SGQSVYLFVQYIDLSKKSVLDMSGKRKSIFHRPEWLIIGIICIAANLRAPVTGVAPVIESIQHSFSLTAAQAGLLTSSPLLVFALFFIGGCSLSALGRIRTSFILGVERNGHWRVLACVSIHIFTLCWQ